MSMGMFTPATFTIPENPILIGTGNALVKDLVKGCMEGIPCTGQINGMGEFEIPVVGVTVPGSSWMYLLAAGAVLGLYLTKRKSRR